MNQQIHYFIMTKLLSTKLSRETLKKINGGANGMICCVNYCGTNECAVWTEPKVKCPLLPECI